MKLTIVNHEFLNKNGLGSSDWDENSSKSNRQITYLMCTAFVFVFVFFLVCCLLMRCKRDRYQEKRYSPPTGVHHQSHNIQFQYTTPSGSMQRKDTYKYYNTGGSANGSLKQHHMAPSGLDVDGMIDKEEYFAGSGAESTTSSNDHYEKEEYTGVYDNNSYKKSYSKLNDDTIRSPSLINNIQDLDSSPRSKRRTVDHKKGIKFDL